MGHVYDFANKLEDMKHLYHPKREFMDKLMLPSPLVGPDLLWNLEYNHR